MADAAAPTGGDGRKPQPALDEVMLAMDVVDTLRHNENIALQELSQDGRDDTLKARLRQIYEGQGLAVSDRILDEGIKALKESRFVYTPRGTSMGRRMAGIWADRNRIGKWLAAIFIALCAWAGWGIWERVQTERRAEAERVELSLTLPQQLQKATDGARAEARTDDARARVEELQADGQSAVARADLPAARAAISALDKLRDELAQTYVLRIVSRPGERSGVFRIPDANDAARNYYLIVEAVSPDGKVLPMPVTSEENGKVRTVTKWAIRVPQRTFDAVGRDKADDGIVQNNILGRKPRGALKPVYDMAVMNGAITDW